MNEMKISIPDQLIEDTIRMELIRNIDEKTKENLIESVVKHAMTQKKDNYSSSKTYFQEAVNEMIENEAKKIFKEWIESNRRDIAVAMKSYLNDNKQAALTKFCENLADNIMTYGINVRLNLERKEY